MTTDDRLVHAIADYLAARGYLTHADRDTIAKAFTAGWHAHAQLDAGGAHRLDDTQQLHRPDPRGHPVTPEDLCEAVDTLVPAVTAEPVLIQVGSVLYELAQVEAATNGRLVLHVGRRAGHREATR